MGTRVSYCNWTIHQRGLQHATGVSYGINCNAVAVKVYDLTNCGIDRRYVNDKSDTCDACLICRTCTSQIRCHRRVF